MKLQRTWFLLAGLLLLGLPGCGESAPTTQALSKGEAIIEQQAIAFIKNLGGDIRVNDNNAVVLVSLSGDQVSDASLKELAGLTQLQVLRLTGTQVTDAGLKELVRSLHPADYVFLGSLRGWFFRRLSPGISARRREVLVGAR